MVTILLFLNFIFAQTNLTISPPLIELKMPAGSIRKFDFAIINEHRTSKVPLAVFPVDIIQTRTGGYEVVEDGKGILSCVSWLQLKDTLFTLEPGTSKEITGFVRTPIGVKGGRYGGVAVETRFPKESRHPKSRIVVILQITITPEIKPSKVTITDLKLEEPSKMQRFMDKKFKNALAVIATVKNEGDIHIKNTGTLIIRDKNGRRIREYPLGGGGKILPNTELEVVSVIPKPKPGEYIAEGIIRFGSSSPAVAKTSFTVTGKKVEAKGSFNASIPIALTIKPEMVELPIFPNAAKTSLLTLTNEEDKEIKVSTQIKELLYDETGEMRITDTTLAKWSCVKWIETEPKEFNLKPYEKKSIKLTIKAPADSSGGGRYACIKFDVQSSAHNPTTMPTSFYVPVNLTFTKPIVRAIAIEKIGLTGLLPPRVAVLVRNTGNIHFKPAGKVMIYAKTETKEVGGTTFLGGEQMITEFALKEADNYILPDGVLKLEGEASGKVRLHKGNYKIKVEIDLGKGERVTEEKEIKI